MSYDFLMADEIKIGKVLTELLKRKNLSLRQLSKDAGVPASTLSEWTSGRAPKNLVHAKKVAKALGVTTHFLLFGEEDDQEPIQKILKEDFFQGTGRVPILVEIGERLSRRDGFHFHSFMPPTRQARVARASRLSFHAA